MRTLVTIAADARKVLEHYASFSANGGGWAAIRYTFKKAGEAGGIWKLYKAMRSKNGLARRARSVWEAKLAAWSTNVAPFPKSARNRFKLMTSDMQAAITADFWSRHSVAELQQWTPRQLEYAGRLIQPVLYERGNTHFRPLTWLEAFDRLERKMEVARAGRDVLVLQRSQ